MLPGVGICGSDSISKILIQLLEHFKFEIHGIWINNYEVESNAPSATSSKKSHPLEKIITTSLDNVLLNKNINLIFVCCQPNLHSKITAKALGIYLFFIFVSFSKAKFVRK